MKSMNNERQDLDSLIFSNEKKSQCPEENNKEADHLSRMERHAVCMMFTEKAIIGSSRNTIVPVYNKKQNEYN